MKNTLAQREILDETFEPEIEHLVKESEKSYIPNPLQTFEDYKKRLALKIKKNFIDEFHVLRDGYTFIGNNNSELKENLKTSEELKKILRDPVQVNAALKEGKSFQEILCWSNDDLVEIYALASHLYDQKHFYESGAIFKLLCVVQPKSSYFWMRAGDALSADNRKSEALVSYYGGLNANPYSFDLYERLCKVLDLMEENAKALAILDEALTMLIETEVEASSLSPELVQLKVGLNDLKVEISKK